MFYPSTSTNDKKFCTRAFQFNILLCLPSADCWISGCRFHVASRFEKRAPWLLSSKKGMLISSRSHLTLISRGLI